MKKTILLAASLLALNLTPVFGQQPVTPPAPILPPSSPRLYTPPSAPPSPSEAQQLIGLQAQRIRGLAGPPANQPPALTKFNLDFPGGTPTELVKAIEKAMGKPLNVIIPDEDADFQLPALKLNDITFPQLSDTLKAGSLTRHSSTGWIPAYETGYWFMTTDNQPTDTSVWFFHVEKKPEQPPGQKICQFYSLAPYLDRGFTVDDITTAIQTGWKMAGVNPTPELDYHKETKLLIAFGEQVDLNIIQSVLGSLPSSNATRNELDRMNFQIAQLTDQITQLKKKISPPPSPPSSSEEKSGK